MSLLRWGLALTVVRFNSTAQNMLCYNGTVYIHSKSPTHLGLGWIKFSSHLLGRNRIYFWVSWNGLTISKRTYNGLLPLTIILTGCFMLTPYLMKPQSRWIYSRYVTCCKRSLSVADLFLRVEMLVFAYQSNRRSQRSKSCAIFVDTTIL